MNQYWLVVGPAEHFRVAFENGNIWGLQGTKRSWWERLSEGDGLVLYVTRPIGGPVGLGRVRTKFKQDKPLWPEEIRRNQVLWPLRFEFDLDFCFPLERWKGSKLVIDALRAVAQAGFQPLKENARDVALEAFEPLMGPPPVETRDITGLHDDIKAKLVEMGKIQKFLSETEYPMETTRLDVVWRRVEKSVPTYVFEVQVGGDIYHALAKLKHAYDLWNSRIFLVAAAPERTKVDGLLSGTFHEIRDRLKFIEIPQLHELYARKKGYKEFEEHIGIF